MSGMPNYMGRCDRLRRRLQSEHVHGLLVTSPFNVTYLTGFTGHDSSLLVGTDGSLRLISDHRYSQQIREECPEVDALIRKLGTAMLTECARLLARCKLARVAVEANHLTLSNWNQLRAELHQRKHAPELVEFQGMVEDLREI